MSCFLVFCRQHNILGKILVFFFVSVGFVGGRKTEMHPNEEEGYAEKRRKEIARGEGKVTTMLTFKLASSTQFIQ